MSETTAAETTAFNIDIQTSNGSYGIDVRTVANSTPLFPVAEALSALSMIGSANDLPLFHDSSSQWQANGTFEETVEVSSSVDCLSSSQAARSNKGEIGTLGDFEDVHKSEAFNESAAQLRISGEATTTHNGYYDKNESHCLSVNGCQEDGIFNDPEFVDKTEVSRPLDDGITNDRRPEAADAETCENDLRKHRGNGSDLDSLSATELRQLADILFPMLGAVTSSALPVTSQDLQQQLPPASEQVTIVKHQPDDDISDNKTNDETVSSLDDDYTLHDYYDVDDEDFDSEEKIDTTKSSPAGNVEPTSADQVSSETPKEPLPPRDDVTSLVPTAVDLLPSGVSQQQAALPDDSPLIDMSLTQVENCKCDQSFAPAVAVPELASEVPVMKSTSEQLNEEGRVTDAAISTPTECVPTSDCNRIDTPFECSRRESDNISKENGAEQHKMANCQDNYIQEDLTADDSKQHHNDVATLPSAASPDTNDVRPNIIDDTDEGSKQQIQTATATMNKSAVADADERSQKDDTSGGAAKDRKDSGSKMERGLSRYQRIALLMKLQKEMAMMQLEMTKLRSAMRSADELLQQLMDSEFEDEKD